MKPDVLIIGCGFLGEAAAVAFSRQGLTVAALARSCGQRDSDYPFPVYPCDITDPGSMEPLAPLLRGVSVAIHAVSSGKGGAEAYAAVYREGLLRVIDLWAPERMIFVGSTSVYAQVNGERVTEDSPAEPGRETGRILLEAEAIALSAGGSVARLSGIYGPGRSVLLKKFLAGDAVLEDGGGRWINQIHRDDAVAGLIRLADPSVTAGLYNVSDDTPSTQRELYGWMTEVTGLQLPREGPADFSRKRGWTSKQVDNSKLRRTGWAPLYPSYRSALPGLLESMA